MTDICIFLSFKIKHILFSSDVALHVTSER